MNWSRVVGLVLGMACFPPTAATTIPERYTLFPPTATVLAARDSALTCGQQTRLWPQRSFGSLGLYVSPDLGGWQDDVTHQVYMRVDYVIGRMVWVLEGYEGELRVWYHALLHALYKLPGTSPYNHHPAFQQCGILVI